MTRQELEEIKDKLIEAARQARKNAYAPFSNFRVGAAVLSEDGRIFTGVNVEPPVMNLGICSERLAIYKGISEGAKRFVAVAIVGPTKRHIPPCGACRQILFDFGVEWVIMVGQEELVIKGMDELLPDSFREDFISEVQ